MRFDAAELRRFELHGVLGEGADLQVFAAIDTDTGRQVVVKRPHPALVARQQHRDVEGRLERAVALREDMGDRLPQLAEMIGHTTAENHDGYFGDSLAHPYVVTVEERARGLPLVGTAVDGIKGAPIGLPQNLFALHPLVTPPGRRLAPIVHDILEVAEAFHGVGVLLLDLRPQNVFFAPLDATLTIVDLGYATAERAATRGRDALDLNDLCLEIFRWYAAPFDPPADPTAYGGPYGMDSVPSFARDADYLLNRFSELTWEPLRASATSILSKVGERGYRSLADFRRDFGAYSVLAEERYHNLAESAELVSAWTQAMDQLHDLYWRKFLFDSRVELTPYERA